MQKTNLNFNKYKGRPIMLDKKTMLDHTVLVQ